jgi:hypothetical protein
MEPKKMLQRMLLYGRDLSILIGSNDRMANKALEKILPKFLSDGIVPGIDSTKLRFGRRLFG